MDCNLSGTSVHGDSPGKNAGVGIYLLTPIVLICICMYLAVPHGMQNLSSPTGDQIRIPCYGSTES